MTTEEKKAALEEAGIKVRSNATDKLIERMYAEEFPEPKVETVEELKAAPAKKAAPASSRMAEFFAFLEAHADPTFGDKTPVVVAWARANLSPEEFQARYEGRTIP